MYTSLTKPACTVISPSDDYVEGETLRCPGVGGYSILNTEFDLREDITIVDAQGTKHVLDLPSVIDGGFSYVGAKAEWRVKKKGTTVTPIALIVRFFTQHTDDNDKRTTKQYLVVAKITPNTVCVTDSVISSATMNIQARRKADTAASHTCLQDAMHKE